MSAGCQALDSLTQKETGLMDRMNKRVDAMQRLAELIQRATMPAIPNPAALIPVTDINMDVYNQMRASCPFLNLPAISPNNLMGLDTLRSKLNAAYSQLMTDLENNPLLRLNRFQQMLSRFQKQMNIDLGAVQGYLKCADGLCNATSSAGGAVSAAGNSVNTYAQTLAAGPPALGTAAIQANGAQLQAVKQGVSNLMI